MINKNIKIENKIINHIQINGKKNKSEKILLKSIKELQKSSLKQTKKIVQSTLILSSPIFKFNIRINQKNKKKKNFKIIPDFIVKKSKRVSFAIKSLLSKKKEKQNYFKTLKQEIVITFKNKSNTIESKKKNQNQIKTINKNLIKYYKWN